MEAKSEPNCCCYCCHILWVNAKHVQMHLNSNIAAYRAQILFALDCPCRASSRVTLVPKNHATAAYIGCTVRWINATTAPQFAGVMLLRPLHGVACLHYFYWGWKQPSASCTVIGTYGDRGIKRRTCLLWWQNKNIASRSLMNTGQSFQLCLHYTVL
jgi:hypothetical protein